MEKKHTYKSYLTTKQAADYLNVSTETIRVWTNKGCLNTVTTLGGHRRFKLEDLEDFALSTQSKQLKASDLQQLKILIIEDDKQFAAFLSECVKSFADNIVTDIAHDGFEAGYKTMSVRPDIVLLDLLMNDINGIKICRNIKSTPEIQHARIISITGHNSKINSQNLLIEGAEAILEKPVDEVKLKQLILKDNLKAAARF